jgi:hypothetical protein
LSDEQIVAGLLNVEACNEQFRQPNPNGRFPSCRPKVGPTAYYQRIGDWGEIDQTSPEFTEIKDADTHWIEKLKVAINNEMMMAFGIPAKPIGLLTNVTEAPATLTSDHLHKMVVQYMSTPPSPPIRLEYLPPELRQKRTHRKSRINKKWFKRYGLVAVYLIKDDEILYLPGAGLAWTHNPALVAQFEADWGKEWKSQKNVDSRF